MPVPIHMRPYLIPWPPDKTAGVKSFLESTHRIIAPEETLKKIEVLRELAGITRCADITSLDCVGIPTYTATRAIVDHYDENISVYNGKGVTHVQAKVSALMEAFERHAAERHQRGTILETLEGMSRYGKVIDPRDLALPPGESYEPKELLEWVCGTNLLTGEPYFVPAMAVFFPYRPKNGARFFKNFSDTNGLASGNSLLEAAAHALAEVIERDAETNAECHLSGQFVDHMTIESPLINELLSKFDVARINVYIKEVTSELGIPTFVVATDDPVTEDPLLLCRGIGTHVNSEIALIRALTEAAQSRCALISGSREDIVWDEPKRRQEYQPLREQMCYWYRLTFPLKDFREIRSITFPQIVQDMEHMLIALQKKGFNTVVATDLTHSKTGIPVVRVIVPGLAQLVESKRKGPRIAKSSS